MGYRRLYFLLLCLAITLPIIPSYCPAQNNSREQSNSNLELTDQEILDPVLDPGLESPPSKPVFARINAKMGKISSTKRKNKLKARIKRTKKNKDICRVGESVLIQYNKKVTLRPGEILTVERKHASLITPNGETTGEKDFEWVLETVGALQVTEITRRGLALATILVATDEINPGDTLYYFDQGEP